MEILNGRCYERSVLYKHLTVRPIDSFTNEIVSSLTIKKMYDLLPKEQQKIVNNINALSRASINFISSLISAVFMGFNMETSEIHKKLGWSVSHNYLNSNLYGIRGYDSAYEFNKHFNYMGTKYDNTIFIIICIFFLFNCIRLLTQTSFSDIKKQFKDLITGKRRFIED